MKNLLILLAIICQITTETSCLDRKNIAIPLPGQNDEIYQLRLKGSSITEALDSRKIPVLDVVKKLLASGELLHFYFSTRQGKIVCLEVEHVKTKIQDHYLSFGLRSQKALSDPDYIIDFKKTLALLEHEFIRSSWISAVIRAQPAPPKKS